MCIILGLYSFANVIVSSLGSLGPLALQDHDEQLVPEAALNTGTLDAFAVQSLKAKIVEESSWLGDRSTLKVFARVDVGIMGDERGRADFFVTGIERLPSMCLWASPGTESSHLGPVSASLASHLLITCPVDVQ